MTQTKNLLLFRKWDLSGIEVKDPGLHTAISLRKQVLPYTYGRSALKRFNKADVNIVERLANKMDDDEFEKIKRENPKATINSKEAAYYFKIFREYHPQDSVLGSIGIWTGFDFAEEREKVKGTVDGDLKHDRSGDEENLESEENLEKSEKKTVVA